MSKFKEFFEKAAVDDAAKEEFVNILGDKILAEASNEQFEKISELAKNLGVDVTAEEIKAFANGNMELDDDELDGVAGGWAADGKPETSYEWWRVAREVHDLITKEGYSEVGAASEISMKYGYGPGGYLIFQNYRFFKFSMGESFLKDSWVAF